MHPHVLLEKVLRLPFLLIWSALTAAAAVATAWFVGRTTLLMPAQKTSDDPVLSAGFAGSRNISAALLSFIAFLAAYVALILAWEHFDYYDYNQFTLFTLQGHNFPPPIWREEGRFFPLGFQEFNLVHYFSRTIFAYHAIPIIQLVFAAVLLLSLDPELKMTARIGLAAFVMVMPSMMIIFGGLIYPERNLVFWLLCLLFFVQRFDRAQSTADAVAAIISAQFMLYYKETAFLLLWGFVAGRLLLRCRDAGRPGWDFNRLREKTSCLDLCLASLGLLFVLYYLAAMFPHSKFQYASQERTPEMQVLLSYLKLDLLAWLFAIIVVVRVFLIWKRKIIPSPFWEALAFGGLIYLAAFLRLGFFSGYYLAPMDIIAVLYLGRLMVLSWPKQPLAARIAFAAVLCALLIQNLSFSVFREYERKNLVQAKAEMAEVIQARCQPGNPAPRLFFPFANRYVMMEFAAYLSYLGVPVEGAGDHSTNGTSVAIISPAMTKDGPLEDYRSIIAHPGSAPQPDDLVIVFPDDDVSTSRVAPYLDGGDTIFSWEPHPRFPSSLLPFAQFFHIASPQFERKALPDHWLDASITLWKGPKTVGP